MNGNSDISLEHFLSSVRKVVRDSPEPADCVEMVAPLMHQLISGPKDFLEPKHFVGQEEGYARNAIHVADAAEPSLYALVWAPGQWTPVHDHGTWGVVGVIKGVLEERNFIRVDSHHDKDTDIKLKRGGPILLGEGTVTTFVPNPDHIHKTGVPTNRETTVSLHLYGREMNAFNIYDVDEGTRNRIDVFHNES